MSSDGGTKDNRIRNRAQYGNKYLKVDENQNIDDMIDLITKKAVPDQRLPFVKKAKNKRSKSGKQRTGALGGK